MPSTPFRFPDKPKYTITRDALPEYDCQGGYAVQLKADGWRCVVEITPHGVTYTSRENRPLDVTRECREPFEAILRGLRLPVGTLIDGEWCKMRPGARAERLVMFDLLRDGDQSWFDRPFQDRWNALCCLFKNDISGYLVQTLWKDYANLFDFWHERSDPATESPDGMLTGHFEWAEGIVLKRLDSPYIGSIRECALNPGWVRCKWRAGEDGLTPNAKRRGHAYQTQRS